MTTQTMHLRKVRAKTRRKLNPETAMRIEEVNTLCSKWVSTRYAVREDMTLVIDRAKFIICDECKAQSNLSGVFGDKKSDDDTVPRGQT